MSNPIASRGRLEYLKQLLEHSIDHGWSSAHSFHYQVLKDIEVGNMTWDDHSKMLLKGLSAACSAVSTTKYMHSSHATFTSQQQATSQISAATVGPMDYSKSTDKPILCALFNIEASGCRYNKLPGGCKKLHMCSICARRDFLTGIGQDLIARKSDKKDITNTVQAATGLPPVLRLPVSYLNSLRLKSQLTSVKIKACCKKT